jgi:rSAM/selenodomain-associated transferase 1
MSESTPNQNTNSLLIFIKNPVLGKVKTRLAATLGAEQALAIYHELLRHTRKTSLQIDAARFLYYSDSIDLDDDWNSNDFNKKIQYGHDLGARMAHAFETALNTSSKVVIIGSDCPLLEPAHLALAFEKLEEYPFVIGPALDGGYYLLGMRNFFPPLFQDMTWSNDAVLTNTLKRIERSEQSYFLLPALPDVDTEADWKKYGWEFA